MRKLGEQWPEEIDGKKHMLKAVAGSNCQGCAYGYRVIEIENDKESEWTVNYHACAMEECPFDTDELIIKDLGVLNDDGLLPCPFCGEYPEIVEESDENDESIYTVEHECSVIIEVGWWNDKKHAIDNWNRRV